jgi:hypothetical protein
MEQMWQVALTPEQIAALKVSNGFARCQDPTTQVVYYLIRCEPVTIDDEYIRQKIDEANGGELVPWNLAEIKAELRRRLSAKQDARR